MLSTLLLCNYCVHKDRSSRRCQKTAEIRPIEFLRIIDLKYFEKLDFIFLNFSSIDYYEEIFHEAMLISDFRM